MVDSGTIMDEKKRKEKKVERAIREFGLLSCSCRRELLFFRKVSIYSVRPPRL